jgi:hypothetical protein
VRRAILLCGLAVVSAGCNCNTILSREESPTYRYEAQTYIIECGVMVPFNAYARIRKAGSSDWTDIVAVREVDYLPQLQWVGPRELRVTIECDPDATCDGDPQRHWSVTGSKRWDDVRIIYAVGDRLRHSASSAVLSKLPQ